MAKPELLIVISSLSKRIDSLLDQQNQLLERIKILELEKENLNKQIQKDKERLDKSLKEAEFLSLSYRLANTPETLIKARQKIAGLIRTIDSCIRMINED